jgi:predicted NUDIX family NTP pyrophosphohydrolase
MMAKESAGLLVYRIVEGKLEVFLVHPGGPFWIKKDAGAWSIPKGEIGPGEDPREAALREFREETGIEPDPSPGLAVLSTIRQPGGKRVYAFALRGDPDPENIRSNTFRLEWPPRSGRQAEFPEVDRAAWFPLGVALGKIHKGQDDLLRELAARLAESGELSGK